MKSPDAMRLAAVLLLPLIALLGPRPGAGGEVRVLRTAASAVAELAALSARRQTPLAEAPPRGTRIDEPVRVVRGRKIIHVPRLCRDADGRHDVVLHFHGAPAVMEPLFQRAGLDAVFVLVNLGVGSGPYEDAFTHDGSLARLLEEVDGVVARACPHPRATRGRLALSAWSAGYGAIYRVLASRTDRELVDAVLLADGLHAGFLDSFRQKINAQQMEPFASFAARAARGERLLGITHTAIVTPSYASTTETARYLVEQLGVGWESVSEAGPRTSMTLLSRADRGGFHVRGYGGRDTKAHCDHLYAMADTLYPMLRERWTR